MSKRETVISVRFKRDRSKNSIDRDLFNAIEELSEIVGKNGVSEYFQLIIRQAFITNGRRFNLLGGLLAAQPIQSMESSNLIEKQRPAVNADQHDRLDKDDKNMIEDEDYDDDYYPDGEGSLIGMGFD